MIRNVPSAAVPAAAPAGDAASAASNSTIRVLVIDDHPLLRAGLVGIISGEAGLEVVGECDDGAQVLDVWAACRPDVAIMDIAMPQVDGLQALESLRRAVPEARVIMLSAMNGDHQIRRAMAAGAAGFLLKSGARKELVEMIRSVHTGARGMGPDAARVLVEHLGHPTLSEREVEVLRSAAEGNSNKHIAAQLDIAEDTVKTHMRTIFTKLGARDRTHAVTIALKRCMISL